MASQTPYLDGRLCTVPGTKHALFEAGNLDSTSVIVFIGQICPVAALRRGPSDIHVVLGGLSDGLTSVGYVYGLVETLKKENWSCIFLTLSSSYSQYGTSSLENDAREIGDAVRFLREQRGKTRSFFLVILQGVLTFPFHLFTMIIGGRCAH